MRWLFLLLVILNAVYFVWHQQDLPLRAKEVAPLSLYKGKQQDIRLLSEAKAKVQAAEDGCLFLGGMQEPQQLVGLKGQLSSMGAKWSAYRMDSNGLHWLRIAPESRPLLGESTLARLSNDINELKQQIISCEGLATPE